MKLPTYECRVLRASAACFGVRDAIVALIEKRLPQGSYVIIIGTIFLVSLVGHLFACMKITREPSDAAPRPLNGLGVFIGALVALRIINVLAVTALVACNIPPPLAQLIAAGTVVIATFVLQRDDNGKPPKKRRAWFLFPSQVQS